MEFGRSLLADPLERLVYNVQINARVCNYPTVAKDGSYLHKGSRPCQMHGKRSRGEWKRGRELEGGPSGS